VGEDLKGTIKTGMQFDVQDIDNHQIVGITVGTIAGVIPNNKEKSLSSCINMHLQLKEKLTIWLGDWSCRNMMSMANL